jgi:hypothetical protein
VPGTFTVTQASPTAIDTNCVVQSMKLITPPGGPLPPWGYDVASGMPTGGRTFCLATTVGGQLVQFYNLDAWANSMPVGVSVPITPQPPAAAPLADLICTSCPSGFEMQITTVTSG